MSQPSAISEFVQEMGHLFRRHELRNGAADVTTLTPAQAYEVQDGFLAGRVKEGAKIVGWKVGCTSAAIRRQFGLTEPISGKLLEPDIFPDGAQVPALSFVDCAVEPELVFRLGTDLEPRWMTMRSLLPWTEFALESSSTITDSGSALRHLQELIASNGIHAGLVLSDMRPLPPNWDLKSEQVWILVNGEVKAFARCAEIMGSPLRSIQWLARHAAERGQRLRAGELVIPGSAVELVKVEAGDAIEARFATLGSCHARLI